MRRRATTAPWLLAVALIAAAQPASAPKDTVDRLQTGIEKWSKVITAAGIKGE